MAEAGGYELVRYDEGFDDPKLVVCDVFRAMLEVCFNVAADDSRCGNGALNGLPLIG